MIAFSASSLQTKTKRCPALKTRSCVPLSFCGSETCFYAWMEGDVGRGEGNFSSSIPLRSKHTLCGLWLLNNIEAQWW